MNFLKILVFFLSFSVLAQSQSEIEELLVFNPDENSARFNELYTENLFFGNFGVKSLVNAVPINHQKVKSLSISAESDGIQTPNVMILSYDSEGKLNKVKISESLSGKAMEVNYVYKDGLISEEIFKSAEGIKTNRFHYSKGKMIIENIKAMVDVYQIKGDILTKQSYLNGKLVFKDRIEGKCRITTYQQEDIDKTCYSSFEFKLPLSIDEFTNSEDVKTGKAKLIPESKWEIKPADDLKYSITKDGKENYTLLLDKEKRMREFNYLGNKSEHQPPVVFSFSYTYY